MTRRAPVEMLAEERARLHRLPDAPHTVAFGVTRTVAANTPMVAFEGGQYSVPHPLLGEQVWVRTHGVGAASRSSSCTSATTGPVEVARHLRATPGSPRLDDAHFPPRAGRPAGPGAEGPHRRRDASSWPWVTAPALWLTEAAAAGHQPDAGQDGRRGRHWRSSSAAAEVDWALGHAAVNARFGDGDLASILDHQARTRPGATAPRRRGPLAWPKAPPAGPRSVDAAPPSRGEPA